MLSKMLLVACLVLCSQLGAWGLGVCLEGQFYDGTICQPCKTCHPHAKTLKICEAATCTLDTTECECNNGWVGDGFTCTECAPGEYKTLSGAIEENKRVEFIVRSCIPLCFTPADILKLTHTDDPLLCRCHILLPLPCRLLQFGNR